MLEVEGQRIGQLRIILKNLKDSKTYAVKMLMHEDSMHRVIGAQRLNALQYSSRQRELMSFLKDMVPTLCWSQNKVRLGAYTDDPSSSDGWVLYRLEKEDD